MDQTLLFHTLELSNIPDPVANMLLGHKLSTTLHETEGDASARPCSGRTDHYPGCETKKSFNTSPGTCRRIVK